MVKINRMVNHKEIKVRKIQKIIKFIFSKEKLPSHKEIKVLVNFIDNDLMQKLNMKYKNRKGTTDILSFNFDEEEGRYFFLGELYLSVPKLVLQAEEFHHSVEMELVILLIHGILHLLGYEHHQGVIKRAKMELLEKKYFRLIKTVVFEGNLC